MLTLKLSRLAQLGLVSLAASLWHFRSTNIEKNSMDLPETFTVMEGSVRMLFHSIGRSVRLGPDARTDVGPPEMEGKGIDLGRSLGRPTVCLPETK